MSDNLQFALVGLVTAIIGGGLAYLTTRLTVRQAGKAAGEQTALDGWRSLAKEYREDKTARDKRIELLEENQAQMHRRIQRLEQERDEHRRWRRLVLTYVHRLREYIAAIPGHTPPEPPDGLNLTELVE